MIMGLNIVRIKGKHVDLCIRRIDEFALKLYTKWVSDEEINKYLGRSHKVATYNEIEKWAMRGSNNNTELKFNIVEKEQEQLIGNCDIEIKNGGTSAILGILIGEESARNKGLGTEVMKLLVKFCFEELRLHRVSLWVSANNLRAIRCYKKAGFQICGTEHEVDFFDGKWHDSHIMEILEDEYWERKGSWV